jgi:hypothetical protein
MRNPERQVTGEAHAAATVLPRGWSSFKGKRDPDLGCGSQVQFSIGTAVLSEEDRYPEEWGSSDRTNPTVPLQYCQFSQGHSRPRMYGSILPPRDTTVTLRRTASRATSSISQNSHKRARTSQRLQRRTSKASQVGTIERNPLGLRNPLRKKVVALLASYTFEVTRVFEWKPSFVPAADISEM